MRISFKTPTYQRFGNRLSYRLFRPLWEYHNRVPDPYGSWKRPAIASALARVNQGFYPDVLVSFGQPFISHLVGLELKRELSIPWLAHFSDPWVDNPFTIVNPFTRHLNYRLEQSVIDRADRVAFTSNETIEYVLRKYADIPRRKALVIPQSFEPLDDVGVKSVNPGPLIIRYLGSFYGPRSPKPLFAALQSITTSRPTFLNDVRFELIGVDAIGVAKHASDFNLPPGLVSSFGNVDHESSLRMMAESDGLLLIDAPSELSIFLPSKLIEYIGTGRPILGLTPPGTAASLIRQLGGLVADPRNMEEITLQVSSFIDLLRERRFKEITSQPWGSHEVRANYHAREIAARYDSVLADMLNP